MNEIEQFNNIIAEMNKELSGIDENTKLLILELFYLLLDDPKLIEILKKVK